MQIRLLCVQEILIPPGVEFEVQDKLDGKIDGSSSDIVSLKQIEVPEEAIAALCSTTKSGYPFQTQTPSVAMIQGIAPSLLVKWKVSLWWRGRPYVTLRSSLLCYYSNVFGL